MATTLTHLEVLDIRSDCGDTFRPPFLGYTEIQRLRDMCENRDETVVLCLRRMLAKRVLYINLDSKIFEQTERLLAVWEQATGMGRGTIATNSLILEDWSTDAL